MWEIFYKVFVLVLIFTSLNQVLLLPVQQTKGTKADNLERIPRRNRDALLNLNENDDENFRSTLPKTRRGSSEEDYSDFRKRDVTGNFKTRGIHSSGSTRPEDIANAIKNTKLPPKLDNPFIPLWDHPYLSNRQDAEDNDGFENKENIDASKKENVMKHAQRASSPDDSESLQADNGTGTNLGKHVNEQRYPSSEPGLVSESKDDKTGITPRHMTHHGISKREANAEDTTDVTPRHMTHHSLNKREANAEETTDVTPRHISHHSLSKREANAEDTKNVTPRHITYDSSSEEEANADDATDETSHKMTHHSTRREAKAVEITDATQPYMARHSLSKRKANAEETTDVTPRHMTHHSLSKREAHAEDTMERTPQYMIHHNLNKGEANAERTIDVTPRHISHHSLCKTEEDAQDTTDVTPRHVTDHSSNEEEANVKEATDVTSRDIRHMQHHVIYVREATADDNTDVTSQRMVHVHNAEATPRHMTHHSSSKREANTVETTKVTPRHMTHHNLSKREANTSPRNHECNESCTHGYIQRSKRSSQSTDYEHSVETRNSEAPHSHLGLYEGSSIVVTKKRSARHEQNTEENDYIQPGHVCDHKCNHEHHQNKRSPETSSSSSEEENNSEHAKIHARHHGVDNQGAKSRNEDDLPMIVEPKNRFSYQEQNPFTKEFPKPRQEDDDNTFKLNTDDDINSALPQENPCDEKYKNEHTEEAK